MTKAKKGLIITLFAAMMVFAFGATAVFADTYDSNWSSDYKSVTVTDGTESATFTNVQYDWSSDGLISATLDWSTTDPSAVPELGKHCDPGYFYDFKDATIARNTTDTVTTLAYNTFAGLYNPTTGAVTGYGICLVQPSYTNGYKADTAGKVMFSNDTVASVAITANGFTEDSYVDLPVTLSATVTPSGTGSVQAAHNKMLVGLPVATKTITVQGKIPAVNQVVVAVDDLEEGTPVRNGDIIRSTVSVPYDGAAHTLVANNVPGYEVTYQQYNKDTYTYDDVKEVSCKDSGTYYLKYIITNVKTKAVEVEAGLTFTVQATANAQFAFDPDGNNGSYAYKVAEGETYDVFDFVLTNAISYRNGQSRWARHEVTEADKAAVAANEAELKAYAKDYYEIDATATKANPNVFTLTIKAKVLSADEQKALNEKYADLKKNFFVENNWAKGFTADTETTATLTIEATQNTKIDDITFTFAPNATYKVKKAKKMKKTKSFTVEAVAKSGNAISYQLTTPNKKISIDPATGKITVKKGLKKGTYKVTVKATTEAGNGYRAAKESVQLTIKVKK